MEGSGKRRGKAEESSWKGGRRTVTREMGNRCSESTSGPKERDQEIIRVSRGDGEQGPSHGPTRQLGTEPVLLDVDEYFHVRRMHWSRRVQPVSIRRQYIMDVGQDHWTSPSSHTMAHRA